MMKIFQICLIMPMAFSMKLHGASNFSSEVDKPHLTLSVVGTHTDTVAELQKVFARSGEAHTNSMKAISQSLTFPSAMDVLKRGPFSKKITSLIVGGTNLRTSNIHVGKGFGGLDGARKLLNDMILSRCPSTMLRSRSAQITTQSSVP
jgi:hypothetical protein